jgi:hypothetical protein
VGCDRETSERESSCLQQREHRPRVEQKKGIYLRANLGNTANRKRTGGRQGTGARRGRRHAAEIGSFRLLSYGVSKRDHPLVALWQRSPRGCGSEARAGGSGVELHAAHNDNGCAGRAKHLFYTRPLVPARAGMYYVNALVRVRVRDKIFKAFDL